MDAVKINRLFNDQKQMKKYIKKDYIQVYEGRAQSNYAKLTCHTLTDKLIDFSRGKLVLQGYIESATANALAGAAVIGIQNGFYSVLRDVKISFNNNEVEHNREPLFTTTYQNLLEYSPDYASSIAVRYGFIKDTDDQIVRAINDVRNGVARGNFDTGKFPYNIIVSLKDVSQFIRRLDFPIINQLFEIEFHINSTQSIIRTAAQQSRFVLQEVTLWVPEIALPTKETQMLYKEISGGKYTRELDWDAVEMYEETQNLTANTPFNSLLGTNQVGINKIIAVVLPNFNDQEFNQTVSNIQINEFNIQINSKDYFNMNIRTDQEAYDLLVDCFNMEGEDVNTGSLLPITDWKARYRIYAVDLSRQEVFEGDPFAVQSLRLRGTPSAAGRLRVFMFKNKKTRIDYSHPENTRTIHN